VTSDRRHRPIHDAGIALTLLTIVPARVQWTEGERTGAAAWFPAVGLFIGSVAWGLAHLLRWAGWQGSAAFAIAAVLVGIWALLTRLLHWDGLADVADGVWGAHTPERRLDIMADSHTGAFGATAVALVAVLEVSAIASVLLGNHELPLLVVPAFARLAPTCAAWLGKPARPGGLGRSVMGAPRLLEIVVAAAVVGTCVWALMVGYGLSGGLLGLGAIFLALAVPHVLSMAVGGVTGDIMGASVLICEAVLFLAAAVMWGA